MLINHQVYIGIILICMVLHIFRYIFVFQVFVYCHFFSKHFSEATFVTWVNTLNILLVITWPTSFLQKLSKANFCFFAVSAFVEKNWRFLYCCCSFKLFLQQKSGLFRHEMYTLVLRVTEAVFPNIFIMLIKWFSAKKAQPDVPLTLATYGYFVLRSLRTKRPLFQTAV